MTQAELVIPAQDLVGESIVWDDRTGTLFELEKVARPGMVAVFPDLGGRPGREGGDAKHRDGEDASHVPVSCFSGCRRPRHVMMPPP